MNNKKSAIVVILFIVLCIIGASLLGIAGRIPFLGNALALIIAVIMILFILGFFVLIHRRK